MTSCLLFWAPEGTSEKGSTLKGKKFVPMGSKFFPLRVDPFSEGNKNNFDRVGSSVCVLVQELLPIEFCLYNCQFLGIYIY